jgi:hypothetical protein
MRSYVFNEICESAKQTFEQRFELSKMDLNDCV